MSGTMWNGPVVIVEEQLPRCLNSLDGKHRWVEKIGKNRHKLDQCVLCCQLKIDLAAQQSMFDVFVPDALKITLRSE